MTSEAKFDPTGRPTAMQHDKEIFLILRNEEKLIAAATHRRILMLPNRTYQVAS